jgi:hypothetical protein
MVALSWTGSMPAALVGAAIYAFAPLRFDLIGTVQHLNAAYWPLVLLFADRYRRLGQRRDLGGVLVATALQTLCSYYLAYATAVLAAVLVAAGMLAGRPRRAAAIGTAALLGFVPLALLSEPYRALRAAAVVPDYPEVWLRAAAAAPSWFVRPDTPLFLGYLPLALVLAGMVGRAPESGWRRGMALGVAAAGAILALGPVARVWGVDVPLPYAALERWVPGFPSLRYPQRFGTLTVLGGALLAALGWARLVRGRRAAGPLTAIALAVIGFEYRQAPLTLTPVEAGGAVPAAYRWLGAHGAGRPLLDWPILPPGDMRAGYQESRAMYSSTYHWLPLLNGYTAYRPPSYELVSLLAQRLPEARSLRELVDLTGVRLLLLHRDRLDPNAARRWEDWRAGGGCERLAEFGPDLICGLPPPGADLRAALVAANERPPRETLRGLPLAPLPASARRGRIVVLVEPRAMAAGLPQRLALEVTNDSPVAWPGLAPLAPGVVSVHHRWRGPDGRAGESEATSLLCDLAPAESCAIVLPVRAPAEAGPWDLELTLTQEAGAELGAPLVLPVHVVPFRTRRGR